MSLKGLKAQWRIFLVEANERFNEVGRFLDEGRLDEAKKASVECEKTMNAIVECCEKMRKISHFDDLPIKGTKRIN